MDNQEILAEFLRLADHPEEKEIYKKCEELARFLRNTAAAADDHHPLYVATFRAIDGLKDLMGGIHSRGTR